MGVDMPDDEKSTERSTRRSSNSSKPARQAGLESSWWSLPRPVRRIFDRFPLTTYSANDLPQRAPRQINENVLYIFQTEKARSLERPSFNPSCLKWQAYLKFHGIPMRTRASNNHASPTGSLPFLLPAPRDPQRPASPVPANRIARWVISQGGKEEALHVRQEAYMALIDHVIRSAWLYHLYLDDANFRAVAWPLYIDTASCSSVVQYSLALQLRRAAKDELLKTHAIIDGKELYTRAKDAFQALSNLLGEHQFFFNQPTPGLFDASLFAYTQVILDADLQWRTLTLQMALEDYPNLVQHRARLMKGFFSGSVSSGSE